MMSATGAALLAQARSLELQTPSPGDRNPKITPNPDINNLDATDNKEEANVELRIGEDGYLKLGGSQNIDVNGSNPNFTFGAGIDLERFGIQAEINNLGTPNQDLDVTGKVRINENFSIQGGVENIGGTVTPNNTIELNGKTGDTNINLDFDNNSDETKLELNIRILTE